MRHVYTIESVVLEPRYAQQWLDVQIVGSEDDLEEHLLVYGDELLVPLADFSRSLSNVVLSVSYGHRVCAMMLAVLENLEKEDDKDKLVDRTRIRKDMAVYLGKHCGGDVRERNRVLVLADI